MNANISMQVKIKKVKGGKSVKKVMVNMENSWANNW